MTTIIQRLSWIIFLTAPLFGQQQQTPIAAQPAPAPATAPAPFHLIVPAVQPALSPGVLQLLELEGRFAQSVAEGGGKAFATWFAEDAVILSDGQPAVRGRGAITLQAAWDPHAYTLTWATQGAQMGPSSDMGFTWGHYEGRSLGAKGEALVTSGRYITIWRKLSDGTWKVAMDASATEPAGPAACCTLPKP